MSKQNTFELSKNDVNSFNSEKIKFTKDKDFEYGLLLIHAEWCGHCKNLMPKYKILSNTFRNIKETNKLNKQEVEWENIPELLAIEQSSGINIDSVNGYPTIYIMNSENKKEFTLTPYEGGREIKDLIEPFIEDTTIKFR